MTRIKRSLSLRIFIIVLLSLLAVLVLSRIVLKFYAPQYYYQQKMNALTDTANEIASFLENTHSPQQIYEEANIQAAKLGGIINITDLDDNVVYSSQYRPNISSTDQMRGNMGGGMMGRRIRDDMYYSLDETGDYELINYDLETDEYIITTSLTVPVLEESINTLSNLYNYLFLASLLIALIVSYLVARYISKPLIELNEVANEIAQLNLDIRHISKREDEIGQLGSTLNDLAKRLQTTINRLQQELSKEKQSERLRRNFVARASHELQTPLSIIKGYTEALSDDVVDSELEQKEYYSIIALETEKLSKMVLELLELSKLENPEYSFNKESFDLAELTATIVKKFKDASFNKAKNIDFSISGTRSKKIIYGDINRIEQAVNNILKNAITHTPKNGSIDIELSKDENQTTLEIFNSGSYIPEENLANIWDSFYTTNIDKQSGSGSGLGLAIAKQIFNRHNALYGAENVDDGVKFWFSIRTSKE
ncbi:MAG: ATP-binding protein [Clostridia bacterium]